MPILVAILFTSAKYSIPLMINFLISRGMINQNIRGTIMSKASMVLFYKYLPTIGIIKHKQFYNYF